MQAFKTVTSAMAYLPIANIDTDMIIPKQYLKTIKRTGLGAFLFAELRYDEANQIKPDFILNQPAMQKAHILIAEDNFGCGSSREHAVWSLMDFGFQVIIAPSFADIFYSNCFKNGLLPITLPKEDIECLLAHAPHPLTVNLQASSLSIASLTITFSMEPSYREKLLQGVDEIDETLSYEKDIAAFEKKQQMTQPWICLGECHA